MVNKIDQAPTNLSDADKRLSRRDFVKLSAFATGSLVVVDALNKASKLATPTLALSRAFFGSALGRSAGGVPFVPEGLAPFQDRYTDKEIEQAVTGKAHVDGANAILVDEKIFKFGTPVHIIPQVPGMNTTKIEFLDQSGQKIQAETLPNNLRLPNKPLPGWLPADATSVPEDSAIMRTRESLSAVIDWTNRFYEDNGVNSRIPSLDKIHLQEIKVGDDQTIDHEAQIVCSEGTCTEESLLSGLLETIKGKDGYDWTDSSGKTYFIASYQSPVKWAWQVRRQVHELNHTPHDPVAFAKYGDPNHPDEQLLFADETYVNAMTAMGVRGVFLGQDAEKDKAISVNFPEGKDIYVGWFKRIVADFNKKDLEGQHLLLSYGAKGDMVGLENLYDSSYGKGAFRKTLERDEMLKSAG